MTTPPLSKATQKRLCMESFHFAFSRLTGREYHPNLDSGIYHAFYKNYKDLYYLRRVGKHYLAGLMECLELDASKRAYQHRQKEMEKREQEQDQKRLENCVQKMFDFEGVFTVEDKGYKKVVKGSSLG